MNVEQARFNMIEQQIRPWDVLEPSVLGLLARVRREDFVPEAHQALERFVCAACPLRLGCPASGRLGCWRLNLLEAHALHAAACLQDGLLGEAWQSLRSVCPDAQLPSALESPRV